jgi:hypothetical protein
VGDERKIDDAEQLSFEVGKMLVSLMKNVRVGSKG